MHHDNELKSKRKKKRYVQDEKKAKKWEFILKSYGTTIVDVE